MIPKYLITNLLLIISSYIFAQTATQNVTSNWLLLNPDIQMESNDAINDLYNFKFEKAEAQFDKIKKQYPHHPIAYFLIGLSEYWKIVPDDNVETYDKKFHAYMDSAIMYGEALHKEDKNNKEAVFFLAAANGFKGKVYSLRDNYGKAAWVAKDALNYFEFEEQDNELSPEFKFGAGLYNYFREWIPEEKPWLKMLVFPFKHGDKEKGIRQLNEVALNAFFTRTEAYYYLLEIYLDYEYNLLRSELASKNITKEEYDNKLHKRRESAYKIAEFLHQSYPDNSYFALQYAKITYLTNRISITEKVSLEMIEKANKNYFGYNDKCLRPVNYYVADYLSRHLGQYERSLQYFNKCVEISEKSNEDFLKHGYCIYSLEAIMRISKDLRHYEKALECAQKIKKYYNKKSEEEKSTYLFSQSEVKIIKELMKKEKRK